MTMILDVPTLIPSPNSMVLFDDTSGRVVYFAPKEWRLRIVNGKPVIAYYEDQANDVAFLQMEFEPWFESDDLEKVRKAAQQHGKNVDPARYLGKDESGQQ